MAEGIAGNTPASNDQQIGIDRSFLMSLCEAGQQFVTVTGVYKKNVELMFLHTNPTIRCLEEVATAPDVCDKTIKWSVRYLVEKGDERQPIQSDSDCLPTQEQP